MTTNIKLTGMNKMKRLSLLGLLALWALPAYGQSNFYVNSANGNIGIGTTSPIVSFDASAKTDALALPVGTTGTRPAGVSGEIRYNSTIPAVEAYVGGVWTTISSSGGGSGNPGASSAGRLQCGGANCSNSTGSSTLNYCPYKGNVKTTASQGNYTIPSGCLSATLTSMYVNGTITSVSPSTLYYIYLWYNTTNATWYLYADTAGHSPDPSTGIEIKTGDPSKTLVGMIYVDANKHIMTGGQSNTTPGDTNTVATWDNRQITKTTCAFSANRTTTSTTLVEINGENRCRFMSWGDPFSFFSSQTGYVAISGRAITSTIFLDGNTSLIVTNAALTLMTPLVFKFGYKYSQR